MKITSHAIKMATFLILTLGAENVLANKTSNNLLRTNGWYLNAGVGYGTDIGSFGNVNLGYQFNRNLALETGYLYPFSKSKADKYFYPRSNGQMFDLALKGILPVTKRLDLYGKAGVVYRDGDYIKGFDAMFGVGLDFHVTKKLSLDLGYNYVTGNHEIDVMTSPHSTMVSMYSGHGDYLQTGLTYHFK